MLEIFLKHTRACTHMNLAKQAYVELYEKSPRKRMVVKYHGNLKEYNATVEQRAFVTTFRLSKKLESCEPEIQMGVMQFLLNKLNKSKIDSEHIDLYHSFVRKMSDFAPVTDVDEELAESFTRMNEEYFHGMMSMPNRYLLTVHEKSAA